MTRLIITMLLFLEAIRVFGTGIVGGNLEMHLVDNTIVRYNIVLNLYVNGAVSGKVDSQQIVKLVRVADESTIRVLTLARKSSVQIKYDKIECDNSVPQNLLFNTYELEVLLYPEDYSSERGFYMVWGKRNVAVAATLRIF